MIEIINVTKDYKIPMTTKKRGLKNIFWQPTTSLTAIHNLNLTINSGEVIGLVGHNGAGKSTIIKMLSGILTPTSGVIKVLDFIPDKKEKAFLNQIGLMMGNKSMLFYDLPIIDSFNFYQSIYTEVTDEYKKQLSQLMDKIELTPLLNQPVRKLSLGQRMKAELILAIAHQPKILFLDEPTLGLDFKAKKEILKFIKQINQTCNMTIILTTHDLNDIDSLCTRLILLNQGEVTYDGDIKTVEKRHLYRRITIESETQIDLEKANFGYQLIEEDNQNVSFIIKKEVLDKCLNYLNDLNIDDISVNKLGLEYILYKL